MKREDLLSKISDPSKVWDVVVIGGGATGLGVAVDAVTRGYIRMGRFCKSNFQS